MTEVLRFGKGRGGRPTRLSDEIRWRLEATKPGYQKYRTLEKAIVDELFRLALKCKSPKVRLTALMEVFNRLEGKPAQRVELSAPGGGPIEFSEIPIEQWSAQELRLLEEIRRYGGPQLPAIETSVVQEDSGTEPPITTPSAPSESATAASSEKTSTDDN